MRISRRAIPPDVIERFGHLHDHQYRGNGEHSSACPQCGGERGGADPSDRFRFWERQGQASNFWCRRCGFQGFTDDNKPAYRPDPQRIADLEAMRKREATREAERLKNKIEALQDAAYWQGWYDAMSEQQRQLWQEQGIIDYFIDYYKLGFCPDYQYQHGGRLLHSPSMTIPHYGPGWQLVNVQHRLLDPADGAGKYRQMAGLPASMFRTEPDEKLTGPVLVVEGAKKAIVAYTHLGPDIQGVKAAFVGVTSKTPSADMLAELVDCEPVYLALDPDAYQGRKCAASRAAERLGRERVRFVQFPAKPDDLLVEHGLTGRDLKKYIRQATVTV